MIKSALVSWFNPFLELVVPERCRVCGVHLPGRKPAGICGECLAEVDYLGPSVCRCCGGVMRSTVAGGQLCEGCLRKQPAWNQAISVVRYGPVVRTLLYRLKYGADTTVLPALQTIVQPFIESRKLCCTYVLPVPLHLCRLQNRGMNQAVHLARLFFPEKKNTVLTDLLQRNRATLPQTGLDGKARRKNLRGAFQLSQPELVYGESVCIVDDVYTTGTTVAECCKVVREAGATEIKVITLARVVIGGEGAAR